MGEKAFLEGLFFIQMEKQEGLPWLFLKKLLYESGENR